MRKSLLCILLLYYLTLSAQFPEAYQSTYDLINNMLVDKIPSSFKDAVFATENAYCDGQLDIDNLKQEIEVLVKLSNIISNTELITYENKDSETIIQHASLFRVMTDSIYFPLDKSHMFVHSPYEYDFDGYDNFVNQCTDTILKHDPKNLSGLMLKANYQTNLFEYVVNQVGRPHPDILKEKFPEIYQLLEERNITYRDVDNTGFREMPQEAYEHWLNSVNEEKEKQEHNEKYNRVLQFPW